MGLNLVSYSGGKDSGATALVMVERGYPFELVFADTGNEHQITYDFIHEFAHRLGLPVKTVKTEYTREQFDHKIDICMSKWLDDGVAPWRIREVIGNLQEGPSGNPFLDMCRLYSRFPSPLTRFCSRELKQEPIFNQVVEPALAQGRRVVSVQGIRAEESRQRASYPERDRVGGGLFNWRPIISWTIDDVLAVHRRHNMPLNPLYKMGFSRVGCMPCINARKAEIYQTAGRFPEVIERIKRWEKKVSLVSHTGPATFFHTTKIPGRALYRANIASVVSWSKTGKGGRQFPLIPEEHKECSSIYGLCE